MTSDRRVQRAPAVALRGLPVWLALAVIALGAFGSSSAGAATGRQTARSTPPYWLLRGPGVTSFGAFAGYVWRGQHVRSVAATWTVPAFMPHSPSGIAATWIGVQAPGNRTAPFIQVGINEVYTHLPGPVPGFSPAYYAAFYSDTNLSFHPVTLFHVRRGDVLAARLRLAGGRWHVLIVDHTHHHKAAFGTMDDAVGAFNQAEWLQEDPSVTSGGHVPYPSLSTVGFSHLKVNGGAPSYARVRSTWMSEHHVALAPGPLVNDSFSFAPTQPSPIGMHYLQIQVTLDVALNKFAAHLVRWNPQTPARQMASQRTAIASALRANIQELSCGQWPVDVQPLCGKLVAADGGELTQASRVPTRTLNGIRQWLRAWVRVNHRDTEISLEIRRLLRLPQLFPVPGQPV